MIFSNPKTVIFLKKDKLTVSLVRSGSSPKIIQSDSIQWTRDSLAEIFDRLKSQVKNRTIRLILGEELAYTLMMVLPPNLNDESERQLIAQELGRKIPEALENNDWDYKETGKLSPAGKEVIIFAPVKADFSIFKRTLLTSGFILEAVEPEALAKTRHQDPVCGIVLKKDLKGKDREILNLTSRPPVKSFRRLLILTGIIIVLLILGGIFWLKPKSQPVPPPANEPLPSVELSPTPEPIDLGIYKVWVLNGSGVPGAAGDVEAILSAEGFRVIETDNADNYNYEATEIQFKSGLNPAIYQQLERALNSDYDLVKSTEELTGESQYDLIIIVGTKKEANL